MNASGLYLTEDELGAAVDALKHMLAGMKDKPHDCYYQSLGKLQDMLKMVRANPERWNHDGTPAYTMSAVRLGEVFTSGFKNGAA